MAGTSGWWWLQTPACLALPAGSQWSRLSLASGAGRCAGQPATCLLPSILPPCRGQPFTAPTYALLLHQWLLVHSEAGGEEQRLKHLNVLFSGEMPPLTTAGRRAGHLAQFAQLAPLSCLI